MLSKSLFLVGEIGGNDYNLPIFENVPFETIRTFTPSVVAKISSTITVSHSLLFFTIVSILSHSLRNSAGVHSE
jgi:hypothetical protein